MSDWRRIWWWPPLPTGARVLELGSGAGSFVNAAKARGWEVEHFDPAFGGPTAETFSYPPGRWDAVFAWQVIEHLTDPLGVFQRIRTGLTPGGYFVLSTPSARCLEALVLGRRWDGYDRQDHRHWWTPRTLRYVLWQAGFRDVRVLHQRVAKHWPGPRLVTTAIGAGLAALRLSSRITVVAR